MKISMQKPIIDAEAFMKFFEETADVKFVDIETGKGVIIRKKYLALKVERKIKNTYLVKFYEKKQSKQLIAPNIQQLCHFSNGKRQG